MTENDLKMTKNDQKRLKWPEMTKTKRSKMFFVLNWAGKIFEKPKNGSK